MSGDNIFLLSCSCSLPQTEPECMQQLLHKSACLEKRKHPNLRKKVIKASMSLLCIIIHAQMLASLEDVVGNYNGMMHPCRVYHIESFQGRYHSHLNLSDPY